jgi:hypothetical protein
MSRGDQGRLRLLSQASRLEGGAVADRADETLLQLTFAVAATSRRD